MEERKPFREVAPALRVTARELRRTSTEAEAVLWDGLRSRRLGGLKFRRQHAMGRFVLDFFCPDRHLAIELDGGVHDAEDQIERDAARTTQLEALGYRVLRFRNEEVLNALPAVLDRIRITAQNQSPLSRMRERGLGGEGSERWSEP